MNRWITLFVFAVSMVAAGVVLDATYTPSPVSTCTEAYNHLLTEIETQINTHTDPTPAQLATRREWIERCRMEPQP
jgi:hypothetical protein